MQSREIPSRILWSKWKRGLDNIRSIQKATPMPVPPPHRYVDRLFVLCNVRCSQYAYTGTSALRRTNGVQAMPAVCIQWRRTDTDMVLHCTSDIFAHADLLSFAQLFARPHMLGHSSKTPGKYRRVETADKFIAGTEDAHAPLAAAARRRLRRAACSSVERAADLPTFPAAETKRCRVAGVRPWSLRQSNLAFWIDGPWVRRCREQNWQWAVGLARCCNSTPFPPSRET